MKDRKFGSTKLIPILLNGAQIQVNPASIDKSARTLHHGEYKGTKVNSPESFKTAESLVLWPEAGKSVVISMSKPAAMVFAQQLLESEGHTVTLKI